MLAPVIRSGKVTGYIVSYFGTVTGFWLQAEAMFAPVIRNGKVTGSIVSSVVGHVGKVTESIVSYFGIATGPSDVGHDGSITGLKEIKLILVV